MNTIRARVWQFRVQGPKVRVTEVGQDDLQVGLARLIHINALACDLNRVLDYRTKQLEVRLLASYLDAPGTGGPLQVDHQAFVASSRHIRGFVTESSGLGMLTAASEALFAWDSSAHGLHSFDALPGRMLTDYRAIGIRPDLLFHLPGGRIAGEARGRHRRPETLLPKEPLAEQKSRLQELALWSASHRDHAYFMSWVWIGRSGVAADIFLPEAGRWDSALDPRWQRHSEGRQWDFPVREQQRRPPERPTRREPDADLGPLSDASPPGMHAPPATGPLRVVSRAQPAPDPQEQAAHLAQRLYDTAPEANAELAGIPVRGTWVPADALGSARHEVLLAVLGEQPPRQVGVRERLARAQGRFDACLDGRLLTVVRSAAAPPPRWHDLEQVLLSSA
ncbi:hypothetical protein EV284_4218 [Streptomyces sp. BK022]|uniref:hypothetical protein n=1 Tax=Streptomyces sp. BK022 TaxID=2512123 RepID=UPI00102A681B|nr:hypothetical protein [Streptomyces sp. BK022]RZU36715.1 hypothetical protein EV284_4218 [Streptomyces sp. BK022]